MKQALEQQGMHLACEESQEREKYYDSMNENLKQALSYLMSVLGQQLCDSMFRDRKISIKFSGLAETKDSLAKSLDCFFIYLALKNYTFPLAR